MSFDSGSTLLTIRSGSSLTLRGGCGLGLDIHYHFVIIITVRRSNACIIFITFKL